MAVPLLLWSAIPLAGCADNHRPVTKKDGGGDKGGDGPMRTPACMDGIDNDGDGKTDYPKEPGCEDPTDEDETDEKVPPECSNGVDDDLDGKTDYPDDPGCPAAGGIDESRNPLPDACGMGETVVDITKSDTASGEFRADDPAGTLAGSCGGAGSERVYLYRISSGKHTLYFSTVDSMVGTPADTVLYVRSSCEDPGTELGCNDNVKANVQSQLTVKNLGAGKYYVVVDTPAGATGSFHLTVASYLSKDEPCETATDGGMPPKEVCAPGLMCKAPEPMMPTVCVAPKCNDEVDNDGDGKTDFPFDPGCKSATGEDEADMCPAGSGCPTCSNGKDDDLDGKTDFPDDPGCAAASDTDERDECYPSVLINPLDFTGASGDTSMTGSSKSSGSCSPASTGPEVIYRFTSPEAYSSLIFSTDNPSTLADTVLYVRQPGCDKTTDEIACNNDAATGNKRSTLTVPKPAKGDSYFVFVDSVGSGGKYRLTVKGTVAEGAACDPASPTVVCEGNLICKAGTCQVAKCDDKADGDGDGKTDYPGDPGCDAPTDDDEKDDCPSGATCPQCSNGADDDLDGVTDWPADTGCTAASDPLELKACKPGVEVLPLGDDGASGTLPATLSGMFVGSCAMMFSSPAAPEIVYGYSLRRSLKSLTFSTDDPITGSTDTLVYVRKGACDTASAEVACSDDIDKASNLRSRATADAPTAGTYFVFVDSKYGGFATGGPFRLLVSGVVAAGDTCDPTKAQFTCEIGTVCKDAGAGPRCLAAACNDAADNDGDGKTDYPFDPGCATPSDNDEADPVPAPLCANAADDDFDSYVDYPADAGCSSAADNDEKDECIPGVPFKLLPAAGDKGVLSISGGGSKFSAPCDTMGSSAYYREVVYYFPVDRKYRKLVFSTDNVDTTFDTVLYARYGVCGDSGATEGCHDDVSTTDRRSTLTMASPKPGPHFIFVDNSGKVGATMLTYKLTVSGVIAQGEKCDAAVMQLVCEAGSLCKGGICERAKCSNTADDDMDGKTDFPYDAGCSAPDDDDESDPASAPQCANSMDDDGDGKIDFPGDPGCSSASDTSESDVCAVGTMSTLSVRGVLPLGSTKSTIPGPMAGGYNVTSGGCSTTTMYSPEDVWLFRVDRSYATLTFDTARPTTYIDTVLYIRANACDSSTAEIACDDDSGGSYKAKINLAAPTRGSSLYVFIDGKGSGGGMYELYVTAVVGAGERCTPSSATEACEAGTSCKGSAGAEKCTP